MPYPLVFAPWNVGRSYPSEPELRWLDANPDRCDVCQSLCEDEHYRCQHKDCHNTMTCIGCIYECSVCKADRCKQHIVRVHEEYVCTTCFRTKKGPEPLLREKEAA